MSLPGRACQQTAVWHTQRHLHCHAHFAYATYAVPDFTDILFCHLKWSSAGCSICWLSSISCMPPVTPSCRCEGVQTFAVTVFGGPDATAILINVLKAAQILEGCQPGLSWTYKSGAIEASLDTYSASLQQVKRHDLCCCCAGIL